MTTDDTSSDADAHDQTTRRDAVGRRHLLAAGCGVGVTLLAGCSAGDDAGADGSPSGDSTTSTGSTGTSGSDDGATAETPTGTFRLLVSDQPVAIDDFDSLEVSFDRARVFRTEQGDSETASPTATATATGTKTRTGTPMESGANETTATRTATPTGTATATATATATESESAASETADDGDGDRDGSESENEGDRGFTVIDLDGATVDLTRLVGPKASGVFAGELEAGRYTKIELYAAEVGGVVDGESVDVTIPSGKLMLTKPFEVTAGETVRFVFDINVVRKGNTGSYNLLPVVSESGVAGTDVAVEEVDGAEGTEASTSTATTTPDETAGGDGEPDDASAAGQNGQGQS